MYVSKICAEGILVTFPWWLKNVKSRSKIALFFQMSAILKFDFQERKQLHFSELNYLNFTKKDPILHVTTTFSINQEETRTNSVPIPHPLKRDLMNSQISLRWLSVHKNRFSMTLRIVNRLSVTSSPFPAFHSCQLLHQTETISMPWM